MILGVGLDLCDTNRMRRALARPGFLTRVFDPAEIRECDRRARRHVHYAARFAAKEAYFKALGTGWGQGVGWKEVAVRSRGDHLPTLLVRGTARRLARALGVRQAHLSLSHCGDYAVAVVVFEGPRSRVLQGKRRSR